MAWILDACSLCSTMEMLLWLPFVFNGLSTVMSKDMVTLELEVGEVAVDADFLEAVSNPVVEAGVLCEDKKW